VHVRRGGRCRIREKVADEGGEGEDEESEPVKDVNGKHVGDGLCRYVLKVLA
jgi:hypothetical protein